MSLNEVRMLTRDQAARAAGAQAEENQAPVDGDEMANELAVDAGERLAIVNMRQKHNSTLASLMNKATIVLKGRQNYVVWIKMINKITRMCEEADDDYLFTYIVAAMSDEIKEMVVSRAEDSREVLAYLEGAYGGVNLHTRHAADNTWDDMKLAADTTGEKLIMMVANARAEKERHGDIVTERNHIRKLMAIVNHFPAAATAHHTMLLIYDAQLAVNRDDRRQAEILVGQRLELEANIRVGLDVWRVQARPLAAAATASPPRGGGRICWNCDVAGHTWFECKEKLKPSLQRRKEGGSKPPTESKNRLTAVTIGGDVALTTTRSPVGQRFWLDSAATIHVTNDMRDFTVGTYRPVAPHAYSGSVAAAEGTIVGVGVVTFEDHNGLVELEQVHYDPKGSYKLVSQGKLRLRGATFIYSGDNDERCSIVIKATGAVVLELMLGGPHDFYCFPVPCKTGEAVAYSLVESAYDIEDVVCVTHVHPWAERHHVNDSTVEASMAKDLITGVSEEKAVALCEPCTSGKLKRRPIRAHGGKKTQTPGERLHIDILIAGHTSFEGFTCALVVVDEASRYKMLAGMRKKSEALDALKKIVKRITNRWPERRVRALVADGDGAFSSVEFIAFADEHGIAIERVVPAFHEGAAVVERSNGLIRTQAKALLRDSGFPLAAWWHACTVGVKMLNVLYSASLTTSPMQLWDAPACPVDVSHWHRFGAACYFVNERTRTVNKFEGRGDLGFLLGYHPVRSQAFFILAAGKIHHVTNVIFDETATYASRNAIVVNSDAIERLFREAELGGGVGDGDDDDNDNTVPNPTVVIDDDDDKVGGGTTDLAPSAVVPSAVTLPSAVLPSAVTLPSAVLPSAVPLLPSAVLPSAATLPSAVLPSAVPVLPSAAVDAVDAIADEAEANSTLPRGDGSFEVVVIKSHERKNGVMKYLTVWSTGEETMEPMTSFVYPDQRGNRMVNTAFAKYCRAHGLKPRGVVLATTAADVEPKTIADVYAHPHCDQYLVAMEAELRALFDPARPTLVQVDGRPPNTRAVVSSKWVFKSRSEAEAAMKGNTKRARLVAQDMPHLRTMEVDTYAPVVSLVEMRLALAFGFERHHRMYHGDVPTAFLKASVPTRRYIYAPKDDPELSGVYEVTMNLYGWRDGPRSWYRHLIERLRQLFDHVVMVADCVLLIKGDVIIVLFVDDLVVSIDPRVDPPTILQPLADEFGITWVHLDVDTAIEFVGTRISSDGVTMTFDTKQAIDEFVGTAGVHNHQVPIPVSTDSDEVIEQEPIDNMRAEVGKLAWISRTSRPDLANATRILQQWLSKSFVGQDAVLSHIKGYLRATRELSMTWTRRTSAIQWSIKVYTDASIGRDVSHHRAPKGILIFLNDNLVEWRSTVPHYAKAIDCTTSSKEAELMALEDGIKCAIYIKDVMSDFLGGEILVPMIWCDNLDLVNVIHQRSSVRAFKHLLKSHVRFCVDAVSKGVVDLQHIYGVDNPADMLTKSVGRVAIRKFQEAVGLKYAGGV